MVQTSRAALRSSSILVDRGHVVGRLHLRGADAPSAISGWRVGLGPTEEDVECDGKPDRGGLACALLSVVISNGRIPLINVVALAS